MILVMVTLGTRGDVDPFVALGRALAAVGHEVRLVAQREFAEIGSGGGVDFRPIDTASARDLLDLPVARAVLRNTYDLRAIRRAVRALVPEVAHLYRGALAAATGADAMLCHPLTFPALDVAHQLGLPVVQVHHVLAEPTRAFPTPVAHRLGSTLGPLGNRASYRVDDRLTWWLTGGMMNQLGGDLLGRPPLSARQARVLRRRRAGAVVGVSPAVLPHPPDWPGDVVTCGYLHPTGDRAAGPMDDGTRRFLAAGPRPVLVTLGSTPLPDPDAFTRVVVAASEAAGLRLILQSGLAGLGREAGSERVRVVTTIRYDELLPRVAAVVHHAGAGTLAQVLTHGRPSLALPSFADQFFWAHRVPAIGVGPRPLPLHRLTVDRLARRLVDLTTNGTYAERAAEVGAVLRREDGPRVAAEAVEGFLRPA
jgi:sterol 3beta-glucosyltransferase